MNISSQLPRTLSRNTLFGQLFLILSVSLGGCFLTVPLDPPPPPFDGQAGADVTYWPVALDSPSGQFEIYQPQPEEMNGNVLTARAAVSLTRTGLGAPVFGTMEFTASIATDRDTRTTSLSRITVKSLAFRDFTPAEQQDFSVSIDAQLSTVELAFPLDQLMASLDTAKVRHEERKQISNTPPRILFSTAPATLISIHGPPRLLPMESRPGVSRVANTPFILLFDDSSRTYFLKAGPRWVSAADLPGPWTDAATVPPAIATAGTELAAPSPSASPVSGAPTAPQAAELAPAAANAQIIVATEPTELIVTEGNPQFVPLPGGPGGELLYAGNTTSDLLFDQTDQRYYVLLSGRWYSAAALQGPWQYVDSDQLPAAFAQIPPDSPRADVLPFVSKTAEAHEAVLDASIPQTSYIRRDAGAGLTVAYDGAPKFQDVPESPGVAYALNTPEQVFRVNGQYFCCHQAVWYQSSAPTGPWAVATIVPPAIYALPPSCPDYNASYVYVYDSSPDYVTDGYLPGYTGSYVDGSTVVYGTGYDYPGWYGSTYFPPACTWGFDAYYDPYACVWGFDSGLYWGGAGWFSHSWHQHWWRDHPGEHWGAHRWWGPGGFMHAHDIRGNLVRGRAGEPLHSGGAATLAARLPGTESGGPGWHDLYARSGNVARNVPAAKLRSFISARPAVGARDNLFAGRDGEVYRRSSAGWEGRGDSSWSTLERTPFATSTYRTGPIGESFGRSYAGPEAGLEQHYAARSNGVSRSATIHSFHGGGGSGFHGGGSHGGGHR